MSEEGLAAAPVSLQELQGHHLQPGAWQTPHSQQVPVHNMKQELPPPARSMAGTSQPAGTRIQYETRATGSPP